MARDTTRAIADEVRQYFSDQVLIANDLAEF
jgi:hypothetical protein